MMRSDHPQFGGAAGVIPTCGPGPETPGGATPDPGTSSSGMPDPGTAGSGTRTSHQSRWHGTRNQSGFTLLEVMLTVAIAGIILAPVGGWMILAITSQGDTAGRFTDAAQTRLLETYIARDVASAEMITDGSADDLPDLVDCDDGGSTDVVLNLTYLGTEPEIVIYKTATVDGRPALVRRECELNLNRDLKAGSQQTIVHGLSEDPASQPAVSAACEALTDCKQVDVEAELASGATLNTSATRRGTAAALEGLIPGTLRPQAVIDVGQIEPRTQTEPYKVNLSGTSSWDLDTASADLTYQWTGVGGAPASSNSPEPIFEWNTSGAKQIILRVTDDAGNVSTVSRTVNLVNQQPIIRDVSITPQDGRLVGVAGTTEFKLDADVYDPDSNSYTVEWRMPDGASPAGLYTFPADASGTQTIDLTVTDSEGERGVWTGQVRLAPGGDSDTLFFPLPDITKTPPLVNLDPGHAVVFTPSNPPVFLSWELRDSTGAPVATSTDESWSYVVPLSGGGTYTIAQYTTIEEVSDEFRVNHPPAPRFSHSLANPAPTSITFTDLSEDPPYEGNAGIVSRLWDFGPLGTFTDETVDIVFDDPGDYEVTLTVTDADGAIGTLTQTVTVPVGPVTTTTTIPVGP